MGNRYPFNNILGSSRSSECIGFTIVLIFFLRNRIFLLEKAFRLLQVCNYFPLENVSHI